MSVAAQLDAQEAEDYSSPFYFNTSHWRAIDGVKEGVRERSGIMVLTGPTGSGKTMLMRAISDSLEENATPLFLQYASLNFREFVNFLHKSLKVEDEIHDASNKAVALRKFLYAQAERDETAVVFIDEAQSLEPDVLKMLPKLAAFDTLEDGRVVGLQFVLVGGSELREFLDDSDFDDVRGAISRSYDLRFFTREELKHFLAKRLAPIARMTPEPITDDAIEAVGKYTGGSPRLIGMICSHAMLFAAENPGRSIDAAMIEEAAEAQMIEPAENPFAHEDKDDELTGPYSSAELKGEEAVVDTDTDAAPVEDSEPVTISDDSDSSYDGSIIDKVADLETSPEADTDAETAEDTDVDAEDYDSAGVLDSIENSFGDLDDELDETELTDDADDTKKSGSALSQFAASLKARAPSRQENTTRIAGANRKANSSGRQAAPAEKRKINARVAGEREKKIKVGIIACAVAGLAFGIWMIREPIVSTLTTATRSVSDTASRAASTVTTAATTTAERVRESVQGDPVGTGESGETSTAFLGGGTAEMPTVEPEAASAVPAPAGSGWGAKVELDKKLDSVAIPAPAVDLARGALDMVDRALDKGATLAPESVRGAFEEASKDVNALRRTVTASEDGTDELDARVAELVALGDKQFEKQLYVAPRGGNSYETYRKALDLDPDNEAALKGVEKLRAFYSAKADKARAAKEWDRANRHFETALTISKLRPVR